MQTNNFTLVNLDTDSISFTKPDGSAFTDDEQTDLLLELNSNFPEKIKWEHDGIYEKVVVLKAKNYILLKDGKITKKGSSLKSSKIEPALKQFMGEVIDLLLTDRRDDVLNVYHKYVYEVHNLTDISPWVSKRTVTEAVLNPERSNEQKVLDAVGSTPVSMGDKIYVYYADEEHTEEVPKYRTDKNTKEKYIAGYTTKVITDHPLRLRENWDAADPDHSVSTLLSKLYKTLVIFKNVIDIATIPKYHLKGKTTQVALAKVIERVT